VTLYADWYQSDGTTLVSSTTLVTSSGILTSYAESPDVVALAPANARFARVRAKLTTIDTGNQATFYWDYTNLARSVPYFHYYRTTSQSFADSAYTTLIANVKNQGNEDGSYDNTTGVFTAREPGLYLFEGSIMFSTLSSAGTLLTTRLEQGSGTVIAQSEFRYVTTAWTIQSAYVIGFARLIVGDTVEFKVYHDDGSARNSYVGAAKFSKGTVYFRGMKIDN
jgi:hypothetical protein